MKEEEAGISGARKRLSFVSLSLSLSVSLSTMVLLHRPRSHCDKNEPRGGGGGGDGGEGGREGGRRDQLTTCFVRAPWSVVACRAGRGWGGPSCLLTGQCGEGRRGRQEEERERGEGRGCSGINRYTPRLIVPSPPPPPPPPSGMALLPPPSSSVQRSLSSRQSAHLSSAVSSPTQHEEEGRRGRLRGGRGVSPRLREQIEQVGAAAVAALAADVPLFFPLSTCRADRRMDGDVGGRGGGNRKEKKKKREE